MLQRCKQAFSKRACSSRSITAAATTSHPFNKEASAFGLGVAPGLLLLAPSSLAVALPAALQELVRAAMEAPGAVAAGLAAAPTPAAQAGLSPAAVVHSTADDVAAIANADNDFAAAHEIVDEAVAATTPGVRGEDAAAAAVAVAPLADAADIAMTDEVEYQGNKEGLGSGAEQQGTTTTGRGYCRNALAVMLFAVVSFNLSFMGCCPHLHPLVAPSR